MDSSITQLCSLTFVTTTNYTTNLQTLVQQIQEIPNNSLIVTPEVCLTGFDYANLEDALAFALQVTDVLKKISTQKVIVITMLEKRGSEVYNFVKVFANGALVYERAKARLFHLGDEHKYMQEGSDASFKIIEVAGVKLAILICFELRFKELWTLCEGADVIAIPSWWGVLRTQHLQTLTRALAVMNQCFVVASDASNEECTKLSEVITPQGEVHRGGEKNPLLHPYNKKEIALMRRYLDVGIE